MTLILSGKASYGRHFFFKVIEPFKKVNTICCMLLMTSIVVCFINDVKILLRQKTLKWGFWGHNYSNLE